MMLLQLVASAQWSLRSFDRKAAFLQGETDGARRIAVEPVPELAKVMKLQANQLCQLTKGAYGLMDVPYLWYKTLTVTKALHSSDSPSLRLIHAFSRSIPGQTGEKPCHGLFVFTLPM